LKSEETIRILFVSIIGFGLAAAPAFASCVPGSVQNGKTALLDVPADKRVELTAKTLKMACNWPADIELALVGIFQAPPDYQPSIDLEAASAYPELWDRVCAGGKQALNEAIQLDANAARSHIYRACGVERSRLATEQEYVSADGPFLLPIMIMSVLESYGLDFDSRRALSRGLAGMASTTLGEPSVAPSPPTPPTPPTPPPAPAANP
jgi:hypothetical protein